MHRIFILYYKKFLLLFFINCTFGMLLMGQASSNDNKKVDSGAYYLEEALTYYPKAEEASANDSTLLFLEKSLNHFNRVNDKGSIAQVYFYMANAYALKGEYSESNNIAFQARELIESFGDSMRLARIDYVIGLNFLDVALYDRAMSRFERALAYAEKVQADEFIAGINLAMGDLFVDIGRTDVAIDHISEAIHHFKLAGKEINVGGSYSNLAKAFNNVSLEDSARKYFAIALEIFRATSYKKGEALVYNNLGKLYRNNNQLDEAEELYNKAIDIFKQLGDFKQLKGSGLELAQVYIEQGKTELAEQLLRQSIDYNKEFNQFGFIQQVKWVKIALYQKNGQNEKAYDALLEYMNTKDSIHEIKVDEKVLLSKQRIDFLEREREQSLRMAKIESELQQKELNEIRQRNYLLTGVIIALLLFFLGLIYNRKKRFERRLLQEEVKSAEKINKQLEDEISYRKRKLFTFTLQLLDINNLLDNVKTALSELKDDLNVEDHDDNRFRKIETMIVRGRDSDKRWKEFKLYFEEVHHQFLPLLKADYPNLTQKELRLSALLKLNLSTKEIANILNLSPKSVEVSRYRLRKKLDLTADQSFSDFFNSYDN